MTQNCSSNQPRMPLPITTVKHIAVDGVNVFYREAGSPSAPKVLLLHGFPSSSHQYRHLIPRLAEQYHVLALDFPGYGFTVVPEDRKYKYTFSSLTETTKAFVDALDIKKYAIYIFDYGAPVGFRLALERPESITAIISQNGNAYDEGFGKEFWAPITTYWRDPSHTNRDALRALLTLEVTKSQYTIGEKHPEALEPEAWHLDAALLATRVDAQLDLFLDYRTNVDLYPAFHEYFRAHQPPLLAIWGANDIVFIPPGAKAYKTDLPNAQVEFVDAGHFALESHLGKISNETIKFLNRVHD